MQQGTLLYSCNKKLQGNARRHALDAPRSVGAAVEPSTRVLTRNGPSSVRQAADDHWRTGEHAAL